MNHVRAARFDADEVRRYYDRQTPGFVALGQGGSEGAIHRAVWGPGVTSRAGAFHYVEDRIGEMLADVRPPAGMPHVLDLGCGVGGSLLYLAAHHPLRGTGLTLSGVQAAMAATRVRARGLSDRIVCVEADFTRPPPGLAPADLAFAIESFVHAPSPDAFFAASARLVRPGGVLVVCDDVLASTNEPRAARTVERFRRGWRINSLVSREALVASASASGFACEAVSDLTSWLELARPRDRALAAAVAVFGWLPIERSPFAHIVGGTALQTALARGWIGYELVRFRRDG